MKLSNHWVKAIKHILSYKLKVTNNPRKLITVDRILNVAENYLIKKFPKNHNISSSVFNTLQKLTKSQYLKKCKTGWHYNPKRTKPQIYLPSRHITSKFGKDSIITIEGDKIIVITEGVKFRLGVVT